jgi:hypothetical protein
VVEHLPSICKVLGSIPNTAKNTQNINKNKTQKTQTNKENLELALMKQERALKSMTEEG